MIKLIIQLFVFALIVGAISSFTYVHYEDKTIEFENNLVQSGVTFLFNVGDWVIHFIIPTSQDKFSEFVDSTEA